MTDTPRSTKETLKRGCVARCVCTSCGGEVFASYVSEDQGLRNFCIGCGAVWDMPSRAETTESGQLGTWQGATITREWNTESLAGGGTPAPCPVCGGRHKPGFVAHETQVGEQPLSSTKAVTATEGGPWLPFTPRGRETPELVHSIMFSDGRKWDAINGWRDQ